MDIFSSVGVNLTSSQDPCHLDFLQTALFPAPYLPRVSLEAIVLRRTLLQDHKQLTLLVSPRDILCVQTVKREADTLDMFVAKWITAFLFLAVSSNTVAGFRVGIPARPNVVLSDTQLHNMTPSTESSSSSGQDDGRRAFLTAVAGVALFGAPASSFATPLHKVDYPVPGKCGQAEVPDNAVMFVKQFGGFKDGACAVEGYAVDEGTAKGTGEKDKERVYTIYGK